MWAGGCGRNPHPCWGHLGSETFRNGPTSTDSCQKDATSAQLRPCDSGPETATEGTDFGRSDSGLKGRVLILSVVHVLAFVRSLPSP